MKFALMLFSVMDANYVDPVHKISDLPNMEEELEQKWNS